MTKQGKKKVLFVINDFLIGGAQRLYVELFLHLSAEQYEFHLVTLSDFSDRPHMFSMVPAHVTVHKLNFKGFTDVKSWYEMNSLLKKVSPDILVTSLFFSNTVSRVLCFFKLYKVVAIEQNTYTWKRLHHNLVDKILSFKTAQLVAASKTVARFAAKKAMIREEQFLVIHNSIDTNLIRQAKETLKGKEEFYRNDCGISKESKIIINVARLVPQKNLEVLIEAFALFTKHRKDYTLVIFGAGSLEATLREKIKSLQIESRCFLAGTRQNIFPYYFISEFFVSSSLIEGFGIAHAEALACGLPVLTTKTAGPDEMIIEGLNGFFVEPSAQGIYQGLVRMSEARTLASREEISKTVDRFDSRKIAEKYGELFTGISSDNRIL